MAATLPLLESPFMPSWPVGNVQFKVLGPADDLKIGRGIVERVFINVVNVLGRFKFPTKHSLHNKAVLRFVVPVAYTNVLVSVLDVFAGKYSLPLWRAVTFVKGVVVRTKALCKRRVVAALNGAFISEPENLLHHSRIAVAIPAVVMGAAHTLPDAGLAAVINRAKCFRFRHTESIREGMYGVN